MDSDGRLLRLLGYLALALTACASGGARFPLRDPIWRDTDLQPVTVRCHGEATPKEPHHSPPTGPPPLPGRGHPKGAPPCLVRAGAIRWNPLLGRSRQPTLSSPLRDRRPRDERRIGERQQPRRGARFGVVYEPTRSPPR